MKNTHEEVLLLLFAEAGNFTKSNTSPCVFSRFLNCKNFAKLRQASQIDISFTV